MATTWKENYNERLREERESRYDYVDMKLRRVLRAYLSEKGLRCSKEDTDNIIFEISNDLLGHSYEDDNGPDIYDLDWFDVISDYDGLIRKYAVHI